VTVGSFSPGSVKTNAFFEEHSTTISFESQEPQLVSFLFGMGNDPAMIRVAKLNLQPADANRYRLRGNITLTANYAKREASVLAPAANKPNFTSKPATAAAANKPGPAPNKPGSAPNKGAAALDAAQAAKHRSGMGPGGTAPNKQPPGGPKTNPLSRLVPQPGGKTPAQ
jgi:hypothetical protein